MNMPRPEHPMPQWERANWQNLNGTWEFEFDFGVSAIERELWKKEKFDKEIIVPFCPESRLSGIGYTDFIDGVAYRKNFTLTEKEMAGRTILHIGAADYLTTVYVNGKKVGTHQGGYTSFAFDITAYVALGENSLFVAVSDDVRGRKQAKGKQAHKFASSGCDYTRTTGIWQTVWLEFVPFTYVKSAKYYPDIDNGCLTVTGITEGAATLTLTAKWDGEVAATKSIISKGGFFSTQLELPEVHLWEVGKGGLYDLEITYGEDTVKSYFGMRSTAFEGRKWLLNGKSVFQRTVLDQGFYPDGIYTAPTEEALLHDIELSLAAGFNGARLHQKIFEPRFLYHADRLGYLVWDEYPNWGLDYANPQATEIYLSEWQEAMERDFNSPAVIGWCPFNETWDYYEEKAGNKLISSIYYLTKNLDPTRPCVDTSGSFHEVMEVYDIHDYDQKVERFKHRWDTLTGMMKANGTIDAKDPIYKELVDENGWPPYLNQTYEGQPIYISEYGGIQWIKNAGEGWGYGETPKTEEEFFARYKGLTEAMLNNEEIFGFCYTQLYDIEQEINGLYTYEREEKFDVSVIKAINIQKAAIED
ncbi:MAG: beta-galactosidase [Lachnospiraceae bacterium]|nr:beta-galactosidase [Lachnospiraceae bacterium]